MTDATLSDISHERLTEWYERGHREFPWRATRDPYRVLVAEVMLQQTQAERVVDAYHAFLRRFPTLASLADAPTSEVIRAWQGLGYNRRAVNLQRACRAVVERHGGVIPSSPVELAALPGIGPYTAGAVACFAFEADVGFVDTNIRRVLHRVLAGPEAPTPLLKPREVDAIARRLVPPGRGYVWNQALMELGATLCRARSVECERCPLAEECRARPTIRAALALPRAPIRREPRFETTTRYQRGRIVDALRGAGETGLALADLTAAISTDGRCADLATTEALARGLERDGLVVEMRSAGRAMSEAAAPYDGWAVDGARRFRLPD